MLRLFSSSTTLIAAGAIAVAATAAGCSDDHPSLQAGSDAGDAATAGMSCPDTSGPVDPTALIDDFEDSSASAPELAGRNGSWFASGDGTVGAIMQPSGLAAPEVVLGGRCGSHKALHVTGSGFNDWGSLVALALHYGANSAGTFEELPYDARARGYQGITFFARVGDTSAVTVRFSVSDQYVRPEAGLCTIEATPGKTCYDTYGVELSNELSTQWKQFRIPFTGISQRNFGLQGGIAPDTSKLYDMAFNFPGRVVFDLWVDDVRFY